VEWPLIASSLIILRQYCRNQIESEQSSQKKFTENELVQLKPSKADKFKWGWSLTPGDKTPTPFEFPILQQEKLVQKIDLKVCGLGLEMLP
jgi:hypothetical protein